jgi:hypothetical protein
LLLRVEKGGVSKEKEKSFLHDIHINAIKSRKNLLEMLRILRDNKTTIDYIAIFSSLNFLSTKTHIHRLRVKKDI